jgi:hypothetical protein
MLTFWIQQALDDVEMDADTDGFEPVDTGNNTHRVALKSRAFANLKHIDGVTLPSARGARKIQLPYAYQPACLAHKPYEPALPAVKAQYFFGRAHNPQQENLTFCQLTKYVLPIGNGFFCVYGCLGIR